MLLSMVNLAEEEPSFQLSQTRKKPSEDFHYFYYLFSEFKILRRFLLECSSWAG